MKANASTSNLLEQVILYIYLLGWTYKNNTNMDYDLRGKIALVTGASKGLGYATAYQLALEGCQVIIVARNESNLLKAAKTIEEETNNPVFAFQADVSKKEDIEALTQNIIQKTGGVDIVVANAGGPKPGTFQAIPDDWWYQAIESNLMSTIRLFRNGIELIKKRRKNYGRLLVITTTGAKQPQENLLISNTLRAGVHALVKTLSREIAHLNITVNAVVPGKFMTDRQKSIINDLAKRENISSEAAIEKRLSQVPIKRMGEPNELASYVAFLCSPQANYITGTALNIDGGYLSSI